MAGYAAAGGDLAVVPAFAIHGIDAKELQLAGVDFAGERGDHAAVFKVEKAAAGGGEYQHRQSCVTEDEQLHGAAKAAGLTFVIFAVHALKSQLDRISETPCSLVCSFPPFYICLKGPVSAILKVLSLAQAGDVSGHCHGCAPAFERPGAQGA